MKYKYNPGFREKLVKAKQGFCNYPPNDCRICPHFGDNSECDYWFFSDGSAEKREEREKRLGGVK